MDEKEIIIIPEKIGKSSTMGVHGLLIAEADLGF